MGAHRYTSSLCIEIKVNFLFALCTFLRDLASTNLGASPVPQHFRASSWFTTTTEHLLGELATLSTEQTSPARHSEQLIDLLPALAARSSGRKGFETELRRLVPSSYTRVNSLLRQLAIPFRQYVWRDAYQELLALRRRLADIACNRHTMSYLAHLLHFYGATRKPVSINAMLYPLAPGIPEQYGAWESDIVLLAMSPRSAVSTVFGVLTHEICHALYQHRSRKTALALERFVRNVKDLDTKYAYLYLDESLATAIGNGLMVERLVGALPRDDWYQDEHVDFYAKSIASIVGSYISQGRTLDVHLLRDLTRHCRLRRRSRVRLKDLLSYVVLVSDPDLGDQREIARQVLQSTECHSFEHFTTLNRHEITAAIKRFAPTLVLAKRGGPNLARIENLIPWLQDIGAHARNPVAALRVGDDSTVMAVLVIDSIAEIADALRKAKKAPLVRGTSYFKIEQSGTQTL
jgi:hypothetical protein